MYDWRADPLTARGFPKCLVERRGRFSNRHRQTAEPGTRRFPAATQPQEATMLTRTRTIVACAAALALGSGGTAALATTATTWTVAPGGAITAALRDPGLAVLADITASRYVDTCRASSLNGSLQSGSGLPGRGIGSVTALSLSHCFTGMTYRSRGFPWHLNALSYSAVTGVTAGRVRGIHLAFSSAGSPGCSGIVDGTSATAHNGTIPFRYNNATHTLRFVAGGTLHVYDNTCPPPWHNGDQLAFVGNYMLSPGQAITSP
jgi:hypothetical protein